MHLLRGVPVGGVDVNVIDATTVVLFRVRGVVVVLAVAFLFVVVWLLWCV